jgi:hypothetical protein
VIYTPSSYSPLQFFGLQYALCSQTKDIWVGHEPWSATVLLHANRKYTPSVKRTTSGWAMNPAGFSVFKTSVAGWAGWLPLGWQGRVVAVTLWVNLSQQTSFGAPWIPALLAMGCFILIPWEK